MAIVSTASQGNSATLTKIDKLREVLGTSTISLPQLVVVGDQSSGKSSVLEGITGFAFPRAAELCTRYATQITCRRDNGQSISVSIMPHANASPEVKESLKSFRVTLEGVENLKTRLEDIFRKANKMMGIRQADGAGTAFSEHILKIEISGPDQDHFTVIDVPGIFRRETAGLTEESDIDLVRAMVQRYMQDERTIILAIIPSNVDPATQEILKLAKKVDPEMKRTMGVLTKPDLNIERTTQNIAIQHVMGKGKYDDLTLGYYIVKNRGPDDSEKTLEQGLQDERKFFNKDPWSLLQSTGRAGIDALKIRVRDLLSDLIKSEFPKLRAEVQKQLKDRLEQKKAMGASRNTPASQIEYLSSITERFEAIIRDALESNYSSHDILEKSSLRLITLIVGTNEQFSEKMRESGHCIPFRNEKKAQNPWPRLAEPVPTDFPEFVKPDVYGGDDDDCTDSSPYPEKTAEDVLAQLNSLEPCTEVQEMLYPELESYFDFEWTLDDQVETKPILDYIRNVYNSSRGRDLGTFSRTLIATLFRSQSRHWESITHSYISRIILLIHHFLRSVLTSICQDSHVLRELWDSHILEALQQSYDRAMGHADFLLAIERKSIPYTLDHSFGENLEISRDGRLAEKIRKVGNKQSVYDLDSEGRKTRSFDSGVFITDDQLKKLSSKDSDRGEEERKNSEYIIEQVHDVLESYYNVARKRFVDVVCQQVVEYMLLGSGIGSGGGADSINNAVTNSTSTTTTGGVGPLHVFTPRFIRGLNEEQLDAIAGEDLATRGRRDRLEREIEGFEAARKILKGVA